MKIQRARLKHYGSTGEFISVRGRIKSMIERNKGDVFQFVIDDAGVKTVKEFSPSNINEELVGKTISIVDDHYHAQFNEDGTIDVVTDINENKIGENYISEFLADRPEIEVLFNKHFKGDDINNYTQKIPWRKSPGIELSFGLNIPTYKLNNFSYEFDDLSKEKGWSSQWDTDEDGIYTLYIYESVDSDIIDYKTGELNESLPRQQTVDQLKKLRKMTKGTDIGDRISDMNKQGSNIQYIQNPIDSGIESYEDFEKHNKSFVPSWNLKHLISPFRGESKKKK